MAPGLMFGRRRQPDRDPRADGGSGWAEPSPVDETYYPNGRVASRGLAFSPVTQPDPMHGPPNEQLFQTGAYPDDRDDGPQWSMVQGVGRSPGQQWPHMPHVEQYNFETCYGISWHEGTDGHLPERAGWALVGPRGALSPQFAYGQIGPGGEVLGPALGAPPPSYYYGQTPSQHRWSPEPQVVNPSPTQPYMATGEPLIG